MTTTGKHGQQVGAQRRCNAGFAERIDQLILDERPSAKKLARLHEHLAVCEGCRQRYDKVALAGRLLHGGPEALGQPSAAEIARARERLLGRTRLSPEPPVKRLALRFVFALAAAAAVVAIALPLTLDDKTAALPAGGTPQFQVRGAPARQGKMVGLRAICISNRQGMAKPELRELPADALGRCGVDDALSFAYTNRTKNLRHLFLLGVDEAFEVKWYLPRTPVSESVAVEAGAVDEPLPRAVRLEVQHRSGALRVFALFSAKPLSRDAVADAVARARKQTGGKLDRLELLPLDDTEQRRMTVELTPAPPRSGQANDGAVRALRLDGPGAQKPQEN